MTFTPLRGSPEFDFAFYEAIFLSLLESEPPLPFGDLVNVQNVLWLLVFPVRFGFLPRGSFSRTMGGHIDSILTHNPNQKAR